MSEAFFDGQFIGHTIGRVSEVQISRIQEDTHAPIAVPKPLQSTSIKMQFAEVNTDAIDALMMGLEEQVQAPREATFKGHGVTGTLRNLAFHDDGQELVGTDGCVRMAVTMTGILEDMHFDSTAKNRAWRRLKRRRMLLDCRGRARRRERARRHLRAAEKSIAKGRGWLERETVRLCRVLKVPRCVIELLQEHQFALLTRQWWQWPERLEEINYLRACFDLPPLALEDLHW